MGFLELPGVQRRRARLPPPPSHNLDQVCENRVKKVICFSAASLISRTMFSRICQIPGKTRGCFLKDDFWGLIRLINVCRIVKYLAQSFPPTAAVCRLCPPPPQRKKTPQACFTTFVVYFYHILSSPLSVPDAKAKKKKALPDSFYHRIDLF